MTGPRVSAIRASSSSPVDRNLKKPLGQGRNPGSCLILRGSTDRPRDCWSFRGARLALSSGQGRLAIINLADRADFPGPMQADRQVHNKREAEQAAIDLEAARESVLAVRIERVAPK